MNEVTSLPSRYAPNPPKLDESFFSTWPGAVVLLLLAALPFLTSLRDPFFSDDYLHIERLRLLNSGALLETLRSWILRAEDLPAWWTQKGLAIPYFRPLVTLSFFFDHAVWGLNPFGYHLTNLVLHILTTLLCLGIARRVLRTPFSAWAAAALFALHPCHTEAISWISGRTDLLAGLYFAAAFYAHLRSRPLGAKSALWLVLGFMAYTMALAAKEMALTLPLIILAHNFIYAKDEPLRQRLYVPAALFATSALYLVLRTKLLGHATPPHPFAHGPGDPDMLPRLLSALPLYLGDLTLFIPTEPVLTFPFFLRHPVAFVLLCAITLFVLVGSLRDSRDPEASRFSVIFVVLSLLPVLPVTVGERFLYLPSLGYVLLVGAKLPEVPRPAWRGLALAGLVFAVVAGKAWHFSNVSRSSRQIIDEAVAQIDKAPRAKQLFLVDLPAQSALCFSHAITLLRPERALRTEVLSMAPHFLSVDESFQSKVEQHGDVLTIRSEGQPYLGSYIEQAYLGARAPLAVDEIIDRPGYRARVDEMTPDGRGLRAFTISFPPGTADDRLVLRGRGLHLAPL